MRDPAAQAGRRNIQIMLLELLNKRRHDGLLIDDVAAPPDFRDSFRNSYGDETKTDAEIGEIFRQTLSDLRYSGFVTVDPLPAGQGVVKIRPDGMRGLGQLKPAVSWGEQDPLGRILLEQAADLQETIEDTRAEETRLAQRIAVFDAKIVALGEHVDKRVTDVDDKLAQTQRDLYNQVLVLMAVFVAAFALILTGAQGAQTAARSTTAGWWQLALDSLAIMVPVTGAVVILVFVAWLLMRPR